jgi:hypothetical protein
MCALRVLRASSVKLRAFPATIVRLSYSSCGRVPIFCIILPTAFAYRLVAFPYAFNRSVLVEQGNVTFIECVIMPISSDTVHASSASSIPS